MYSSYIQLLTKGLVCLQVLLPTGAPGSSLCGRQVMAHEQVCEATVH